MRISISILILLLILISCAPSVPVTSEMGNPSAPVFYSTPTSTLLPLITSIPDLVQLSDVLSVEEFPIEDEELGKSVILYKLTYLSDGYTVLGYVAAPMDYLQRTPLYPVLIYNRGGQGDFGALQSSLPTFLADEFNAVVFASQYRETQEGTGLDEFGGDDIHDVTFLLDLADQCSFVDHSNIFMMGASRGSIMTYEIIRTDDRVTAAVVTGSVPDLEAVYNFRDEHMKATLRYRVGGSPEDVPEEYEKRSAIKWADEIDIPVLIFHTEDDNRAPIKPVDLFITLLESQGKEVSYIRMKEGGHCWIDLGMIKEFFEQHMQVND